MKVILLQDLKGLGRSGDIIEVKSGYARNYLVPKKIGLEATKANILWVKKKQENERKVFLKEKEKAEELKRSLEGKSLTIEAEVKNKETEEIFGSITSRQVWKLLQEEGIANIDEKDVILPEESIKKLGIFNIRLNLHPEVAGEIKLWVVKK